MYLCSIVLQNSREKVGKKGGSVIILIRIMKTLTELDWKSRIPLIGWVF